jgi:RES domain-containing protein
MIIFRLCKSIYSGDLSGKGAEKFGGRWNNKGTSIIYACESRALCTTEIAVHTPLGNIPTEYELITLEVPDSVGITELDRNDLPSDWKLFPYSHSTQLIGDRFISDNKYLVLKVPSAVVQGEFNFLINPGHRDIKLLKIVSIEPFGFDGRLFKR